MSHLHLIDGVLSPLWWISGYILTLGIIMLAASKIKKEELPKRVPFVGVISSLMLITMSVPLGFLPFHLNLTVLAGILAGPWLGFIAVFIVNFILALIGHGGITMVGLNTLIIGVEVLIGYFIFRYASKYIKPVTAATIAVIIALIISTTLMTGVIFAANIGLENALPHNDLEHSEEKQIEDNHEYENEGLEEHLSEIRLFTLSGWGAVALILLLGIGIEALVTSLIIAFFIKVRPEMIVRSEQGTVES
ncbi:MAG: energy-coupling factor ABC transporter permease [Clostridia bacterium]